MDKYSLGTNRDTEIAEGSGRLAVNAKYCEPRAYHGVNRYPSLQDKSFSLTIRAVDGCTLLETRVEHMHQALQRRSSRQTLEGRACIGLDFRRLGQKPANLKMNFERSDILKAMLDHLEANDATLFQSLQQKVFADLTTRGHPLVSSASGQLVFQAFRDELTKRGDQIHSQMRQIL